MCLVTLKKMAAGGMHDHIGGGFHRYSVTADWHIPHYEKMLYDQAQLATSYLEAYQITKDQHYADVARDILDYVRSTMTSPLGGFYSGEDAESMPDDKSDKKKEGAFYVWTEKEIRNILSEEKTADLFCEFYDVKRSGNCPRSADIHGHLAGTNTLIQREDFETFAKSHHLSVQALKTKLDECRQKLFEVRKKRPRPFLDDKIIVAWNGLMIKAFAKGFQVLGEAKYLDAARNAVLCIHDKMFNKSTGTLVRHYREGPSNISAFSSDCAFLISGLIDLYEASFEVRWLSWATELQTTMDKLFWDNEKGGYFVSESRPDLLVRSKEDYDGAEPSENSVAALNLLRLYSMLNGKGYQERAQKTMDAFSGRLFSHAYVLPLMTTALMFHEQAHYQIVLVPGASSTASSSSSSASSVFQQSDFVSLVSTIHSVFTPFKVLLCADAEGTKFLSTYLPYINQKDLKAVEGKATAQICRDFTCQLPTNDPSKLLKAMSPSKQTSDPIKSEVTG
eukprot:TRINITY_DN3226_c0_g1_i3.p1 TRINITY_DN3226_c0_g1~~TRINITY_DN3226_c0_g1_i3.p1  ORF type:complete len:506 (-),score=100.67 TRINITY_DN3226_c0_g1_i3:217-1734(-)